jgi:hypothetical protein
VWVALIVDPLPCLPRVDGAPVNRWLAEPDPNAPIGWKRQVHRPHLGEEGLITDPPEGGIPGDRVSPDLRELVIRNVLAAHVAVESVLVLGGAELDDDITYVAAKRGSLTKVA